MLSTRIIDMSGYHKLPELQCILSTVLEQRKRFTSISYISPKSPIAVQLGWDVTVKVIVYGLPHFHAHQSIQWLVILEESMPVRVEMFHRKIKVISLKSLVLICSDTLFKDRRMYPNCFPMFLRTRELKTFSIYLDRNVSSQEITSMRWGERASRKHQLILVEFKINVRFYYCKEGSTFGTFRSTFPHTLILKCRTWKGWQVWYGLLNIGFWYFLFPHLQPCAVFPTSSKKTSGHTMAFTA